MIVLEQMGVPHDQVHQLNLTQFVVLVLCLISFVIE